MYTFQDHSGDKITLRPEATAGIVRSVLENNLAEGGRPTRLFCLGPMFRYERPQKGRQRQFHQLDVEVFGDDGPFIDAEVISLLCTFLTELGLTEVSVTLNSLGCVKCRPVYREKLMDFLKSKEGLCPDCQRRLNHNPLRILDCKVETCQAITKDGPEMADCLCSECQDHLNGVTKALESLNINYVLNNRLVRGLDYYTRTAFEVQSGHLGAQNAVAGGGRYDGLCRQLGGPDLPGIGFAVGLERLILILSQTLNLSPDVPDYYVAILSPETMEAAFLLTHKLRLKGLSVTADWACGSLKSRLKRADRLGAAKVIMLGTDELAQNQVTIRDMVTKEQYSIAISDIEKF
jgi:histidyl-tRNA synthetase